MSPYTFGGILIAFIAYSGGLFYAGTKYEGYKAGELDAQHDLAQSAVTVAAQEKVISTVQKQGNITQGASNDYSKNLALIGSFYDNGVQPTPTTASNGMSTVCQPTSRTSSAYHLTFKQCDSEEAKLNALWNWSNQQAALR